MNGDRLADGTPDWASKPLDDLNEEAIISWWSKIQADAIIDYGHKKPFQLSRSMATSSDLAIGRKYQILASQCSTTVVEALYVGANAARRGEIAAWVLLCAGKNLGPVPIPAQVPFRIPTMTPADVRQLVVDIRGDPLAK